MDFEQAISAHSDWKRKLTAYLLNPDGTLKSADVARDNKCELGRWLDGEGAKFSSLKQFSSLKTEHARFHKAAADIVSRADRGDKVSDDVALGAHSEFGKASTSVVQALMNIMSAVSH